MRVNGDVRGVTSSSHVRLIRRMKWISAAMKRIRISMAVVDD